MRICENLHYVDAVKAKRQDQRARSVISRAVMNGIVFIAKRIYNCRRRIIRISITDIEAKCHGLRVQELYSHFAGVTRDVVLFDLSFQNVGTGRIDEWKCTGG